MTIAGRTVWQWAGLKEEDIEEVGSSMYFPSSGLFIVRTILALINFSAFVWCISIPRAQLDVDLRLLWSIPIPYRILSAEVIALIATTISCTLTAIVSSLHARSMGRSDILARIAGPTAFVASASAVFALAATPLPLSSGRPSQGRYFLHIPPIAAIFFDTVLAAKLRFRIRAMWAPMTVIQTQQGLTLLLAMYKERASTQRPPNSGLYMLSSGILCGIVAFASVCFVWLLSCATLLYKKGKKEEKSNNNPIKIEYPASPKLIARV